MNLKQFKEYVKKHDANKISHDEMNEGLFESRFTLICKKCGSMKVEFFGESGYMGSEYTGYCDGENGFKCLSCGNAITWWQ